MTKPDMTNWSVEQVLEYEKARQARNVGYGVFVFFGLLVLLAVVPLSVFFTRIASGG